MSETFIALKAIDCERLGFQIGFVNGHRDGEAKENATLISEAFAVFHETQLSPRQLVEMNAELVAALGGLTAMCEQHGDFRNGVTDPTGNIDEGVIVAGRVIESARAALTKASASSISKGVE